MNHTFDTPTPPYLDVLVPAGDVRIDATEGATSTEVSLDGPQELLDDAVVEQRDGTIRVEIRDRRGLFGFRSQEVHVVVRCPAGARARLRTKSADLLARGELSALDAATASGDLVADRVTGNVSVKSASGDVQAEKVGGDASFNTASGDVRAGRVGGAFRANLVSGDVRVREVGGAATVNTVSGDVALESVASGPVQVQAVSGDVEVGVRRGSRVHVDANTLSGDTRSDLDLSHEPDGQGEDGPLVELKIKTVSGDIAVVRAAQEVLS